VAKYQHFIFLLPADWPVLSRAIVFALGCAMPLAFAPVGWSLLAPLLVLPLLFVSLTRSPIDAAGHLFWFGFGFFLVGTYWIYISVHVFGRAALPLAILLMVGLSLLMAAFLWLSGWLMSRLTHGEPGLMLLVGPSAWVCVEWLRGWVLTGFPWLALGYGQIDSPLAGWAPVLGVYGVSFMLMISVSAVLVAFLTAGRSRLMATIVIVLPWLVGGILTTVDWTETDGNAIRTTIVQAGLSQDQKWDSKQLDPIKNFYRKSTLGVPDSEFVVWPEVAIPTLDDNVEPYLGIIDGDARRNNQTVLLGILEHSFERSEEGRIYNSVFILGGEARQVYRKRHLVPFGEYFPVPAFVRTWMRMQNLPHSDLAAGNDSQPLLVTANGVKLAIAICYEAAYGAEQLYAFPDAGIFINVSNDAWFGDSIAPHQHLEIARMRALEFGRVMVRATNDGISAFIDHDGALLQVGKQFEPVLMTAAVQPRKGATPYTRLGNWPVIGLSLSMLGIFWIRSRASL
jgi:apolipoprotein N-acyltransferase